jgi:two-component system, OmpR family, phosphate regulon response regulator PhoB
MSRPLVLVVEDDPSVRMTLAFVLEDEGFGVLEAADGEAALQLVTSELPDVILLDHVMPKMAGGEVYSVLRRNPETRDIPVFVLSGMTPRDDDDWVGAYFIGKPFNPDDLVEQIREVLAERSRDG